MSKVGRKTTEVEQFERIEEALELMLYKKLSTQEFRVTFSKMYGVTERTADNIWAKCKQILKDRFTENTDEIISEQLSRYYDLLSLSVSFNLTLNSSCVKSSIILGSITFRLILFSLNNSASLT